MQWESTLDFCVSNGENYHKDAHCLVSFVQPIRKTIHTKFPNHSFLPAEMCLTLECIKWTERLITAPSSTVWKSPQNKLLQALLHLFTLLSQTQKPNTNQKELAGSAPAESQHKDSVPILILAISPRLPLQPHLVGPARSWFTVTGPVTLPSAPTEPQLTRQQAPGQTRL